MTGICTSKFINMMTKYKHMDVVLFIYIFKIPHAWGGEYH
jgi:hypothetical protein